MSGLFSLEGKTALVTGAGRGIGQAIAVGFAAQGADVALASRTESELNETAERVRAHGRRAAVLPVDVGERGAAADLVEKAVAALGRIDILVTSFAAMVRKAAFDISEDEWDSVLDVNLKARFFLAKAVARQMGEGGSIIHIASLATFFGIPNQSPYVIGNGGIGAMVRAQSVEWAPTVRVNAIAPGTILTRQSAQVLSNPEIHASRLSKIPLGRIGDPDDCAGAAVFLASDAARYVTGHVLVVDGGWLAAGGSLKG